MRPIIAGAVALVGAAALSACANAGQGAGTTASSGPAAPAPATSPVTSPATSPTTVTATSATPTATKTATRTTTKAPAASGTSDVSQLKQLGIVLDEGVLLDVADDGLDRYLAVGTNGVVDFTGTGRTDATMMALNAAPGGGKNRVVIKPPFYNEDAGTGSCVADTSGAALKLETCDAGAAAQIWTVEPAGDSGQFELRGKYGIVEVDGGKIITGGGGYTGIQTIRYAK